MHKNVQQKSPDFKNPGMFPFGCTKENPRLCRGEKKALAENKEIKRIPQ